MAFDAREFLESLYAEPVAIAELPDSSCDVGDRRRAALVSGIDDDREAEQALQAARRTAEQLGVLHLGELRVTNIVKPDVADDTPKAAWVTGTDLDSLPEDLRSLVRPRPGWTPESWADYLRRRAALCDERHEDVASLHVQAAAMMAEI